MQIYKQQDKESASAEAGEFLNSFLTENKKKPVLLLLSGGSAFSILDYIGVQALGENLTVCVLDERFSDQSNINNFKQLQKTDFYQSALDNDVSFFGTEPRPGETMEALAIRFEKNIKMWLEQNPKGIIAATLGMGPDGHTAGIFPYQNPKEFEALFEQSALVVAYDALGKHEFSKRITTTNTFLKKIQHGFAYVCGADKKQKLEELTNSQDGVNQIPALIWKEIKDVKIFTDIE